MAGAASPQSAEVPGNIGRTSWQPPSSMTETATQPDGAGKSKGKGNERTNMKDVNGEVVWIEEEVSEREGIV